MIGIYIEFLETRCVNPGNEVLHILDETTDVEVGKGRENNERRGMSSRQFWVGFRKAVDIKVFELGCYGQNIGEDLW